jgi:antitoxin MazE
MKTRIQRVADGLALLIPPEAASEPTFADNAEVEVTFENGAVVAGPVGGAWPTLDEMLARITPENIHPPVDFGPPVGKELL